VHFPPVRAQAKSTSAWNFHETPISYTGKRRKSKLNQKIKTMKIIDFILRMVNLRLQISRAIDSFYSPSQEQGPSECMTYGSEFVDDEVRMVDQPMKRNLVSSISLDDFPQLGQVPYLLVPYHGEDELPKKKKGKKSEKKYSFLNSNILVVNQVHNDSEGAVLSEIPFPWNQFKLYALSPNIEAN